MDLGIVGLGMVGGALYRYLTQNTTCTVRVVDPAKYFQDDLESCEALFLCVPVPTLEDGTQDTAILKHYKTLFPNKLIFCRSTVLPGTCDNFGFVAMPEFLKEATCDSDMYHLPILCGEYGSTAAKAIFKDKRVISVPNTAAEITKYMHNTFGALKVTFCNEIFDLCSLFNVNYEHVREAVSFMGIMGHSHTQVPGPDLKRGYGGHCFPKDVKAFTRLTNSDLLRAVIKTNDKLRGC